MAVKINWTLNAQVVNGPKVAGAGTLEVDAYDNIEVKVPKSADGGQAIVQVQPGGAGKVQFLLIKSDIYQNLKYQIADTTIDVDLDAQLLLIGVGAITLVGGAPKTFTFINSGTTDAHVHILIGRTAT